MNRKTLTNLSAKLASAQLVAILAVLTLASTGCDLSPAQLGNPAKAVDRAKIIIIPRASLKATSNTPEAPSNKAAARMSGIIGCGGVR